jgi:hypothetical protein
MHFNSVVKVPPSTSVRLGMMGHSLIGNYLGRLGFHSTAGKQHNEEFFKDIELDRTAPDLLASLLDFFALILFWCSSSADLLEGGGGCVGLLERCGV